MMRTGEVTLLAGDGQKQSVRLRLTEDTLYVQKQELAYTYSPTDHIDTSTLAKERVVLIRREKPGGLGLSVKGGSEHSLPILISRIFKDQAADKSGRLYVGDAILEVNGVNVETFCHDEAVMVLKNAGDEVTLVVKYFQPASYFLTTKGKKYARGQTRDSEDNAVNGTGSEENGNVDCQPETQWTSLVNVPLLCACVTRFKDDSNNTTDDTFEVFNLDGVTMATVQLDDQRLCDDWARNIYYNITTQNNLSITLTNRQLLAHEHVMYMSWVFERTSTSKSPPRWKRTFLSLKGPDVSLYEMPPVKTRDWVKCEKTCKIYECLFKMLKGTEVAECRPHSFVIETSDGASHCLSVENHDELLKLEKAWYKTTYHAVKHIVNKTFSCTCRGWLSGLTLDFNTGFCLYNSESKTCVWSYRFSQLKGSSDDGHSKMKLQFFNDVTNQIDTWEIDCSELRTLLYSIHAFLSAKLASVDPVFLINL